MKLILSRKRLQVKKFDLLATMENTRQFKSLTVKIIRQETRDNS